MGLLDAVENMPYNTAKPDFLFKEYGRHIQMMVNQCVQIPDRHQRNTVARAIIKLMSQMHPHLRSLEDYKQKLWDHLHIMANYQLDVDSPFPPPQPPVEDTDSKKQFTYPQNHIAYPHYGKNLVALIQKAAQMPKGSKRSEFIQIIVAYMKTVSANNGRSEFVNDETLKADILLISNGEIDLSNENLDQLQYQHRRRKPEQRTSMSAKRDRKMMGKSHRSPMNRKKR